MPRELPSSVAALPESAWPYPPGDPDFDETVWARYCWKMAAPVRGPHETEAQFVARVRWWRDGEPR
jgi:hypothetical protein